MNRSNKQLSAISFDSVPAGLDVICNLFTNNTQDDDVMQSLVQIGALSKVASVHFRGEILTLVASMRTIIASIALLKNQPNSETAIDVLTESLNRIIKNTIEPLRAEIENLLIVKNNAPATIKCLASIVSSPDAIQETDAVAIFNYIGDFLESTRGLSTVLAKLILAELRLMPHTSPNLQISISNDTDIILKNTNGIEADDIIGVMRKLRLSYIDKDMVEIHGDIIRIVIGYGKKTLKRSGVSDAIAAQSNQKVRRGKDTNT